VLGYRTLFPVYTSRGNVEAIALGQLRSWLKKKGYDADALRWNARAELGGATGVLQELGTSDGSRTVRARIVETNDAGRWISTLTVHKPHDSRRPAWVWLDIDGPEDRRTRIPRLARDLLAVFSGASGPIDQMRAEPTIVGPEDVPELVEFVKDESRRRIVFVAGSDELMPLQRWQALLKVILSDTVGLASSYVLDGEATALFNELLGPHHSVRPGTVRTYVDRVTVDDEQDAFRHRVLSTQRLLDEDSRSIARILGNRASAVALRQPLSRAAIRINQQLERQLNEIILAAPTPTAGSSATRPPASTSDAVPAPSGREESRGDSPTTEEHESAEWLREIGLRVLGVENITREHLELIIELASTGKDAQAKSAALAERLEELQEGANQDQATINELRQRLEDEQLETKTLAEEVSEKNRLITHLRSLIAQHGLGAEAWSDPDPSPEQTPPSTFDELLGRASELTRVKLTLSDEDVARDLDNHDPLGRWATQTWDFLLVLAKYAELKCAGQFSGDVDHFISNPPAGAPSVPPQRHARDESATVRNNRKFSGPRTLPVPETVDPRGKVFMGAHYRIAKSGTISPRLHYYDATDIDGNIYVGYIGPHLPNTQTN
jgi:hypothetical protein